MNAVSHQVCRFSEDVYCVALPLSGRPQPLPLVGHIVPLAGFQDIFVKGIRLIHAQKIDIIIRIVSAGSAVFPAVRIAVVLPFPRRIRKSEFVPQSSPVMTALPVSAHNLLHDTDPGSSSHYRRMQAQHTDLQDIYTLRCGNLHMLSVPFRE